MSDKFSIRPNYSNAKAVKLGGEPMMCALHKLSDDEVWLVRLRPHSGDWVTVRVATKSDLAFFAYALPTTPAEIAASDLCDRAR